MSRQVVHEDYDLIIAVKISELLKILLELLDIHRLLVYLVMLLAFLS